MLETHPAEPVPHRCLDDAQYLADTRLPAPDSVAGMRGGGESVHQGAVEIEECTDFGTRCTRGDLRSWVLCHGLRGHRAPAYVAAYRPFPVTSGISRVVRMPCSRGHDVGDRVHDPARGGKDGRIRRSAVAAHRNDVAEIRRFTGDLDSVGAARMSGLRPVGAEIGAQSRYVLDDDDRFAADHALDQEADRRDRALLDGADRDVQVLGGGLLLDGVADLVDLDAEPRGELPDRGAPGDGQHARLIQNRQIADLRCRSPLRRTSPSRRRRWRSRRSPWCGSARCSGRFRPTRRAADRSQKPGSTPVKKTVESPSRAASSTFWMALSGSSPHGYWSAPTLEPTTLMPADRSVRTSANASRGRVSPIAV